MRLKKNVKIVLAILGIVLVFAALALLKNIIIRLNAVPENDPNIVGNTAGNIYNGGYYAEQDGMVYFANAYDNGNIYVMDAYGDNIKKIASADASFINVAGDYIYYYSATAGENNGLGYVRNGRGFYRSKLNGSQTVSLAKYESDSMMLVGNHLYFTAFEEMPGKDEALVTVHSITTSNEDDTVIMNEHLKLGGYSLGNLYYSGVDEDHNVYSYNIGTKGTSVILSQYAYMPIVSGGYVYFLDLTDDYKLKRYSMSDGSIELIANERVDTYNLYNDIIYYQNVDTDGYALKRVYIDGSGLEIVKTGVYSNINITSQYVYFTEFGNDLPVYKTSTHGGVNVATFDEALNAAISNSTK